MLIYQAVQSGGKGENKGKKIKINVQHGDEKTAKKSMSGKIFIQELFPKMFLANHRLWDPTECNICKSH